jgi:hypothetical protein
VESRPQALISKSAAASPQKDGPVLLLLVCCSTRIGGNRHERPSGAPEAYLDCSGPQVPCAPYSWNPLLKDGLSQRSALVLYCNKHLSHVFNRQEPRIKQVKAMLQAMLDGKAADDCLQDLSHEPSIRVSCSILSCRPSIQKCPRLCAGRHASGLELSSTQGIRCSSLAALQETSDCSVEIG